MERLRMESLRKTLSPNYNHSEWKDSEKNNYLGLCRWQMGHKVFLSLLIGSMETLRMESRRMLFLAQMESLRMGETQNGKT
jgi:hypothetical protein